MFLSRFWVGAILCAAVFSMISGTGADTAAALTAGAVQATELCVAMAGPLALWAGLGKLMDRVGLTALLARFLSPILGRLFPQSRTDSELAGHLSANVTANLLGLGNAATPMGLEAARLMSRKTPGVAGDSLCMLVVCNTASIQLLPTTVASVRAAAGCETPFDILPAVWLASAISLAVGITAAKLLSKGWRK